MGDNTSKYRLPALGTFGLTVLGIVLLAVDVFTHVSRLAGWVALVAGAIGLVGVAIWRSMNDVVVEEAPEPTAKAGEGYREVVLPAIDDRARKQRMWIGGAALALIVAQALIPLRYYLGDDHYDERFAWRMFSAVRMHECQLAASEVANGQTRPVQLGSTIHEAWQTTLERNREAAIESYLAWRCEQEGVESSRLENHCRTPSGAAVPTIVREIDCATGVIGREGGLE